MIGHAVKRRYHHPPGRLASRWSDRSGLPTVPREIYQRPARTIRLLIPAHLRDLPQVRGERSATALVNSARAAPPLGTVMVGFRHEAMADARRVSADRGGTADPNRLDGAVRIVADDDLDLATQRAEQEVNLLGLLPVVLDDEKPVRSACAAHTGQMNEGGASEGGA